MKFITHSRRRRQKRKKQNRVNPRVGHGRRCAPEGSNCWWFFFFSSRRRHTRFDCDWSSDVCSSDLIGRAMIHREKGEKTRAAELPVVGSALQDFHTSGKLAYVSVETRFPRGITSVFSGDRKSVV